MSLKDKPTKAQIIASLRNAALGSYQTADEMTAMADQKERIDHACGHQFTITFTCIGHAGITGGGDGSHTDADWESDPKSVTVRAHSLSEALRRAAALPLAAWYEDEEDTSIDS